MGQALYRKHRPKSLKEVVGQEHITDTLTQALNQGRISHAYLFTGPRGVGKTSVARILAHEINELPYTDDSTHMDIIEIDAASNRRIDEIRELREKVYMAPIAAKYKVYIIDEVHMLTREAFNALLKTLEEPPAHVVFILATTDAHKLPDTIISRTQRFSFKPGKIVQVTAHLKQVAKDENIKIDDDALSLLATHGEGSFRDSLSLLDQAGHQTGTALMRQDIERLLGIPPSEVVHNLYQSLSGSGSSAKISQALTDLYEQGYQASMIAKQLSNLIRTEVLNNSQPGKVERLLKLMGYLIEVPAATDPERFLEIILLRGQDKSTPAEPELKQPEKSPGSEEEQAKTDIPNEAAASTTVLLDESAWPVVLRTLKQRHNTLYGVVRMAQPDFSEAGRLKLAFGFAFHQKRITENSNQRKLADIIKELTGISVTIECVLVKRPGVAAQQPTAKVNAARQTNNNLTVISNIFGDAELLES